MPYAIDPSLNIKMPSSLPMFKYPWITVPLNAGLRLYHRLARKKPAEDMSLRDVTIQGASGRQSPAVLYTPKNIGDNAPLLIYYHGGGFLLAAAPMHYSNCERYARDAACKVIAVDYRLSARNPWPCGFEDCYDTLVWARENHQSLGIDPERIAVGGDSAGGALSAGVAQKARDENIVLCGQLLIYPMLQPDADTDSMRSFNDTPLWTSGINRLAWRIYLGETVDSPALYAAPGLSDQLTSLAPCYLETAEFDPLRDEGHQYAKSLQEADVSVELNATRGTYHGYEIVKQSPRVTQAFESRVKFLKHCFGLDN